MLLPCVDIDDCRQQGAFCKYLDGQPTTTKQIIHPVCRLRGQFLHEFSAALHPINSMRLLCHISEKIGHHIIPGIRLGGREGLVSDQLSVGERNIHGLEESGECVSLTFHLRRR